MALEAIKGIETISELSHRYDVHPVQINSWKRTFLERASGLFDGDRRQAEELKELKDRQDDLYKEIGELKMENTWYKKKLK